MVQISENPEEHSALQTSGNLKFLEYCCGQWEGGQKDSRTTALDLIFQILP